MQTTLAPQFAATATGQEAAALLRACVHCGFCTATCPTYQLLGNELDGPRGRIHLVKQVLEGEVASGATQQHLDRCLTCRACETTCPSGVQYGRLLDIGRGIVEAQVPRPVSQRVARRLLPMLLTGPFFSPLLAVGRLLRPVLPRRLAARIPARRQSGPQPAARHARRILLVRGCVQPALFPAIDAALVRVLDRLGISTVIAGQAGCCGALRHHLSDAAGTQADLRRNVAAWWPLVEQGVEAIVVSASGCGTMLRDYGHLLRDDPVLAERAARISALVRDPVELLGPQADALRALLGAPAPQRIAFQSPCSLQHGLKLAGRVEGLLSTLGVALLPVANAHACCGSAGSYSLLQPALSAALTQAKLAALTAPQPDLILSANVGCIAQLGAGAPVPVRHWLEWLDAALARQPLG